MISVILPATDKEQVKSLDKSLQDLKIDYELIPIYGASSFFDAWQKGLKTAKGEYICFTHQDTQFLEIPKLDSYFKNNVGMVGIAGTTILHRDQPWWFSRERAEGNILSGTIYHKGTAGNELSVFGPQGEVVCLDGVCMITTKKILEDVGIPTKDYATWDFYDHVLCGEYRKKGYKLLTIPLIMIHASKGGNKRDSFETDMARFTDEYLQETWRNQ